MRNPRLILSLVLIGTLVTAGYLTLRGFDVVGPPAAQARPLPPGDQEIAFLMPATSGDTWERLVAAVKALHRDWAAEPNEVPDRPTLHTDRSKAFVELTADVAEVALWLEGPGAHKLWIRWYKLSSENTSADWIERLAQRSPPPLAVIGGDISDRALKIGRALEKQRGRWRGREPLFLITTATADHYHPDGMPNLDPRQGKKLIQVYPGRSFRFSFTNQHMARVVLDFVRDHPAVWGQNGRLPLTLAGVVGARDGLAGAALLAAAEHAQPYVLHTLRWYDDSYSIDLAERFAAALKQVFLPSEVNPNSIAYSTGDYFQPNPRELLAVGLLLQTGANYPEGRHLLALPTSAQRAQRLLRALVRRDPRRTRNLVVVTGDSIGFNSIYRDRNATWNIHDMPVSLVFFAHRNPVSRAAGFTPCASGSVEDRCTATDDLLLYRDMLEALVQATHAEGRLLADADSVHARLRQAQWLEGRVVLPDFPARPPKVVLDRPLFDSDGDRNPRTGEHVVWLRPYSPPEVPWAEATITVWRRGAEGVWGDVWREAGPPLYVNYDVAGQPPQGE